MRVGPGGVVPDDDAEPAARPVGAAPARGRGGPRRWPGLLFYREMFGLTSASGAVVRDRTCRRPDARRPPVGRRPLREPGALRAGPPALPLHPRVRLRRRSRRRVRRSRQRLAAHPRGLRRRHPLDVAPLRPDANGGSRQHVAVGTIHYSPTDRGILLYVKPSLTGDEPPDVLQYKTRNTAFPHEATGDQFYDEAQWESYRRLGPARRRAGSSSSSPARTASGRRSSADWVFARGRASQWGATPEGLEDRVLEMTKRFGALEAELQQRQRPAACSARSVPGDGCIPADIKELCAKAARRRRQAGAERRRRRPGGTIRRAEAAMAADSRCLLRVTQLMEDVWMACQLDRWWDHPLNLGWINLFARWATSAAVPFWWPLLGTDVQPRASGSSSISASRCARSHQRCSMGAIADPHKGWIEQSCPTAGTPDSPRSGGSSARRSRRGGTLMVAAPYRPAVLPEPAGASSRWRQRPDPGGPRRGHHSRARASGGRATTSSCRRASGAPASARTSWTTCCWS